MRHNLPVRLTSFVGRDGQLAEVASLLRRHRLVTLTGTGGCGKTRLGIEVAALIEPRNDDGAWWVDLSQVGSEELVPFVVADALPFVAAPYRSPTEAIVECLRGRRVLLALDN